MRIQIRSFLATLLLLPSFLHAADRFATALQEGARELQDPADLDELITEAGARTLVLLGEASHGTHEYYHWRDLISRRLIEDHGFRFIAVEGDWNAIAHLDRYVRHLPGAEDSARAALMKIDRWPLWMWGNRETVALGEWLRDFNADRDPGDRVGIHGIDVYGYWASLQEVVEFYREHYPEKVEKVMGHYRELHRFGGENSGYVQHVYRLRPTAEDGVNEVVNKLTTRYREATGAKRSKLFHARQNAKVVRRAEGHLREMTRPGAASWNKRARHFEETAWHLLEYYGKGSKGIVWAHNTHIGDARATAMATSGQLNIGQLARERHGAENVFAIGFGTAGGTLIAGRQWEGSPQEMNLPSPVRGSVESVMDGLFAKPVWWLWGEEAPRVLRNNVIGHRAVGVVYDPSREQGNYVPTRMARRYDAFIFFPETRALEPLR